MDIDIYEIILTDVAKEELEEIFSYIEKNLSMKNTAKRLMKKIEENILILENNPYLYKEIHVKPHNDVYRRLVVDNYVVLYEVKEEHKQVVIYRVLYGKRDYLIVEDEVE